MANGILGSVTLDPCTPRPVCSSFLPRHVERKIAARWKWWGPWVYMHLVRRHDYDMSVVSLETARLQKRHTEHVVAMMREGITMRLIRRHRLDDPRITDETRSVLVQAVRERRKTASTSRRDNLFTLINLASFGPAALTDRQRTEESLQAQLQAPRDITEPPDLQQTIQSIRRQVCEQFYLREMRDPELTVRTNRRAYVLPRQIAMYIARQLTGATLEEIGREFGGRHHTTVLHSIEKVQAMRRSDSTLDCAIRGWLTHLISLPAGASAGPTQASSAHTRTRRKKILARLRETRTGARTKVLPHIVKQQKFSENIELRRAPSIAVHHRLPRLHKSTH